jgi:hypothetical protein
MDTTQTLNRVSRTALIVLSLTALAPLLLVALPMMLTRHVSPPHSDEGIAAHVFQLSIALLVPFGFVYLATADWKQPVRSMRQLAVPVAAIVLAFGMLFYFEHIFLPAHGYPLPRPGMPLRLLRQIVAAF